MCRGVCFKCDARWSPGHRCANRQSHLLFDEEETLEEEEKEDEKNEEMGANEAGAALRLSTQSLFGLSSSRTLKLHLTVAAQSIAAGRRTATLLRYSTLKRGYSQVCFMYLNSRRLLTPMYQFSRYQCLSESLELQVQPAAIKDARRLMNGNIEVLVQWEGLPECEWSWEEVAELQELFPYFHLEDKVNVIGGSIDGPPSVSRPPIKVYRCRKWKSNKAQNQCKADEGINLQQHTKVTQHKEERITKEKKEFVKRRDTWGCWMVRGMWVK